MWRCCFHGCYRRLLPLLLLLLLRPTVALLLLLMLVFPAAICVASLVDASQRWPSQATLLQDGQGWHKDYPCGREQQQQDGCEQV